MITSAFDGNTQAIIRPEELYAAHMGGAHGGIQRWCASLRFPGIAVEAALQHMIAKRCRCGHHWGATSDLQAAL